MHRRTHCTLTQLTMFIFSNLLTDIDIATLCTRPFRFSLPLSLTPSLSNSIFITAHHNSLAVEQKNYNKKNSQEYESANDATIRLSLDRSTQTTLWLKRRDYYVITASVHAHAHANVYTHGCTTTTTTKMMTTTTIHSLLLLLSAANIINFIRRVKCVIVVSMSCSMFIE